jgi:hypothetical protein
MALDGGNGLIGGSNMRVGLDYHYTRWNMDGMYDMMEDQSSIYDIV